MVWMTRRLERILACAPRLFAYAWVTSILEFSILRDTGFYTMINRKIFSQCIIIIIYKIYFVYNTTKSSHDTQLKTHFSFTSPFYFSLCKYQWMKSINRYIYIHLGYVFIILFIILTNLVFHCSGIMFCSIFKGTQWMHRYAINTNAFLATVTLANWGTFNQNGLSLSTACISDYTPIKVCDEMRRWRLGMDCNFISHVIVITYPC